MLRAAHARIAADRARQGDQDALVIHLGDLCDRGPDTRGVIDDLLIGIADGEPWRAIRGNHDQMFLDFLEFEDAEDPRFEHAALWVQGNIGGAITLRSYGVEVKSLDLRETREAALALIPASHIAFMREMSFYYETPDLICVHAGIRPGVPLHRQESEDLIWIREEFLFDPRDHGKLIVHGHTPAEQPEHWGNRVNLDTGAGFFRDMTVAVFEGSDVWILTDDGREPLLPGNPDS